MRSKPGYIARGFTLVELMVSVSVSAVVMGGITSAMLLASHAIPDGKSASDAVLRGYSAAERIVGELYCAQSFTLRTPTAVEFTVQDRDNDNDAETIRYEWSGTPGDPLTRKYNDLSAVTIAEDVYDYQLDYVVRTISETTTEQVVPTSDVELAYFVGWASVLETLREVFVRTTYYASQYFTINVPAGAQELTFTKASLMLRRDFSGPASVTVAVHPAMNDGSYIPEPNPVSATATILGSSILSVYTWRDADFTEVAITDLDQTEYCLVVKGTSVLPAWVRYFNANSAPANGTMMRWTDDAGSSWDPRDNQIDEQDFLFHLYGTYTFEPEEQETTVDRDFLSIIGLTLRVGSDPAAQVRASSQIMNAPEVTGL